MLVVPVVPPPLSGSDCGEMRLSYCGVISNTGSNIPSSARNCVSAMRTSSRATSMSLLFSSARLIASFSDKAIVSVPIPKRWRLGIGGNGRVWN